MGHGPEVTILGNAGIGPARVILKEVGGQLKFIGMVSHDQSRSKLHIGYQDHFRVLPQIRICEGIQLTLAILQILFYFTLFLVLLVVRALFQ
jgi:hypothetical protein